jgi:hypothetical protein
MWTKFSVLMVLMSAGFSSCTDTETKYKLSENIYTSYSIWGEEDKEFVTAFLQFRSGGPDGEALHLKEPSKVFFDEVLLTADSARESGHYYEVQMPLQGFSGPHTIRFINAGKKEYKEEFVFTPFRLINELGDTVNRNELVLRFEGLKNREKLRIVMTDTAFSSEGINEVGTVINSQLDLHKYLPGISNGPAMLQLFKEEERLIEKGSVWGEISITYSLKREFELKD